MDITLVSAFLSALLWSKPALSAPLPPPPPPLVVEDAFEVVRSYICEVTAYTSREEETDDTPHLAASGNIVYWGMVASNAYPFGTQLRFPDLYGDKVFVVKDRMHSRFENRMDIWFPEYDRAVQFGLKKIRVEVIREKHKPE